MSNYEKIISVLIGIVVVVLLTISYHEITEPHDSDQGPNFEQSFGKNLKIGSFATVLSQKSSGPIEENCKQLEPVIVATLHDVSENLADLNVYKSKAFEVNQQTLDTLCHQNASVTLSNSQGAKVQLVKHPFTRSVPLGGTANEIGTKIRIDAIVMIPGAMPPTSPTTYGEELVPDIYLDQD